MEKKLLDESGVTEAERREVRVEERAFYQEILANQQSLAAVSSNQLFVQKTDQLAQLYERVFYPREANLDAFNLDEFNNLIGQQAQMLTASDLSKFDVNDLIKAAHDRCVDDDEYSEVNWQRLGTAVGVCFSSVAEINFLHGSMDTQVVEKVRKVRRKAVIEENVEELQPTECTDYRKERQDAQARRLKVMQETLIENQRNMENARKSKKRKKNCDKNNLSIFELTVDPKSFTQTVENIFDMSFLIRNGEVEVGLDDEGLPVIENHEQGEDNFPSQKQSILSLTPADWEELQKSYQIEQPEVGHRPPAATL